MMPYTPTAKISQEKDNTKNQVEDASGSSNGIAESVTAMNSKESSGKSIVDPPKVNAREENAGNAHSDSADHAAEMKKQIIRRNVADVQCGAKLLAANPQAKSPEHILSSNQDQYMNQPCASEKWFILETCEPVQLRTIQIANFELFSSRFKTFKVFVSDRYPARSWILAGTFQAKDQRSLQVFDLNDENLIKYIKFEFLDHYGTEHFCPITMLRLFGSGSEEIDDDDANDPISSVQPNNTDTTSAAEQTTQQQLAQNDSNSDKLESIENQSATSSKAMKLAFNSSVKEHTEETVEKEREHETKKDEEKKNIEVVEKKRPEGEPLVPPSKAVNFLSRMTSYFVTFVKDSLGLQSSEIEEFPRLNNSKILHHQPSVNELHLIQYLLFSNSMKPQSDAVSQEKRQMQNLLQCVVSVSDYFESGDSLSGLLPCNCGSKANKTRLDAKKLIMQLVSAYRNYTAQWRPMDEMPWQEASQWTMTQTWPMLFWQLLKQQKPQEEKAPAQKVAGDKETPIEPKTTVPDAEIKDELVLPAQLGGTNRNKDSTIMRLTNRVKAVEINVSVSMQYLEDLSQNYKKQTEKLAKSNQWMVENVNRLEKMDDQIIDRLIDIESRLENIFDHVSKYGDLDSFLISLQEPAKLPLMIQGPMRSSTTMSSGLQYYLNYSRMHRRSSEPDMQSWLKKCLHWLSRQCSDFLRNFNPPKTRWHDPEPGTPCESSNSDTLRMVLLHVLIATLIHLSIYWFFLRRLAKSLQAGACRNCSTFQTQGKPPHELESLGSQFDEEVLSKSGQKKIRRRQRQSNIT
ncbi:hypothetical protein Ciccas_000158 [Cichlidogyrus casuarinus]|uniref:SUN domain-containing protein n=1 Tax=Cichlidogyrus casuarinus TaxID=1844966 RepID=A0ABD2QP02_9PLAT